MQRRRLIRGRFGVVAIASLVIAGGAIAAGFALKPAIAADGSVRLGPFALVTCTSPAPNACEQYKNTSSGSGVEGDSSTGSGVKGTAGLKNSNGSAIGVLGVGNVGSGVEGHSSNGSGVRGVSTSGVAVFGTSTNNEGVEGQSQNDPGVFGSSTGDFGVAGSGNTEAGVIGESSSGPGVEADSTGTADFYADSHSGYSIEVHGEGSQPSILAAPNGTAMAGWFDSRTSGNTNYGIVVYSQGLPAIIAYNGSGTGADINGNPFG